MKDINIKHKPFLEKYSSEIITTWETPYSLEIRVPYLEKGDSFIKEVRIFVEKWFEDQVKIN